MYGGEYNNVINNYNSTDKKLIELNALLFSVKRCLYVKKFI